MDDIENQLRIVLTDLITKQSEGEWDDGLIASDVVQFLPPILVIVQAALDAAEVDKAAAVDAERERCATACQVIVDEARGYGLMQMAMGAIACRDALLKG